MDFSSVVDQPTAVRTLQSALEKNRVAHAYLFIGPAGVGRKMTAAIFAAALNCENVHGSQPCGECSSCRQIYEGRHPGVQLISPIKRSSTITVEQVEAFLPYAYMRPIKGRTKVFILSEADRLGLASANKLLKTLEEPPSSTVFILITERPENMLPTVASRCQPVKFSRLHAKSVEHILSENFKVEPARASLAAELADGQVSRGLQFAQPEKFEAVTGITGSLGDCSARLQALDRLLEFFSNERAKLEEEAEREVTAAGEELTTAIKSSIAEQRKSFIDMHYREFLNDCLGLLLIFYRDVLILKETGIEKFIFNRDRIGVLRKLAERIDTSDLLDNLKKIENASDYCSHYVAEDRVFMDLLLGLHHA